MNHRPRVDPGCEAFVYGMIYGVVIGTLGTIIVVWLFL